MDWGTTHVRAWAIGTAGEVIASAGSAKGMARLKPDMFQAALLELIENWLCPTSVTTVMACGMVGARQGWHEANYLAVPTLPLVPDRFVQVRSEDPRLRVFIIPGLKQLSPPDVMRGEETQIAGFLVHDPDFDGVICMPGTHTKWVRVAGGRVLGFQSFMTGEIFALLERQSVLQHSLGGDNLDREAFAACLVRLRKDRTLISAGLFRLRADDLLNGVDPATTRARLSAYLIGAEVMSGLELWSGHTVKLIGAPHLVELYSLALTALDCPSSSLEAEDLTLKGLSAAHALCMEGEAGCAN